MEKLREKAPNILVECQDLIPSVRVGVLEPLSELERQGYCQVRFRKLTELRRKDVAWCDVLVMVRACEPVEWSLANEAKRHGRCVAYFLDDDLLHVPQDVGAAKYFNRPQIQKALIDILGISDLLWGVNQRLIDLYKQYCPGETLLSKVPVRLRPMAIRTAEPVQKVRLLYAGSTDHTQLVQEFISPAIRRLFLEQKGMVEALFLGVNSGILDLPNVKHLPFISNYDEYRRVVLEGGFDIGMAIVRTSEFYRCKYYNKFVEYTSIGAVGIYTNSEPYTLVVQPGQTGYLCENTVDSWYAALSSAVLEQGRRRQVLRNAQELLENQFSYASIAKILKQNEKLLFFCAPQVKLRKIHLKFILWTFYFNRMRDIMDEKGLAGLGDIFYKGISVLFRHLQAVFGTKIR